MSRDPDNDNQHLPPWLRGVPLPARPAAPGAPSAASTPAPWEERPAAPAAPAAQPDEIPDWLKELSAEAGLESPAAPSEMPAWSSDQAGAVSDGPSADALPSWLHDTSPQLSEETNLETPGADAGLPDWLRDAGGGLPTDTPAASQPSPTPQEHADVSDRLGAAVAPDQSAAPAEPMPAWLSGLVADQLGAETFEQPDSDTTAAGEGRAGEALPDWLRDQGGAAPATGEGGAGEALPDWLRDQGNTAPAAPSIGASNASLWADSEPLPNAPAQSGEPPSGAGQMDESGVPSWLRDIPDDEIRRVMEGDEDGESSISVEPFSFGEPSGAPNGGSTSDVPVWLSGTSDDTAGERDAEPSWLGSLAGESGQSEVGGERDAGPSWLGDLANESAQSETANSPAVPLWLQDLDAAPAAEPQPESPGYSTVEEQPTAPSASEPAEDIPAWLRETDQVSSEADAMPAWLQEGAAGTAPAEEVPAWLNAEAPPAASAAEIPAWLNADTTAPQASAGASPPPAENLPPWLSDAISSAPPDSLPSVGSQPPAPPASAPPVGPADDLPAWLRAEDSAPATEQLPEWLQTSPPPAAPAPAVPTPAADSPPTILPEWLQTSPPPAPPTPAAGAADELPPWLRDDVGQPLPTAGAPGDANLPEWLRGESPLSSGAPATATPPAATDRQDVGPPAPAAPSGPPSLDWFGEEEGSGAIGRASGGESEFFGGAELPAWLRKAEAEPTSEISPADARSLDWLTRLGAHEEESAVVAAAPAIKLPLPQAPVRSDAQRSALVLLQRLAAQPYPDIEPAPPAAQVGIWQRIGLDRALYIVLLVALLAALAVPSLAAGLQSPPQDPAAAALFQQIDALTDKDVVLIGYEWDARRIGELKPLEQAVIGHLIRKRVKLILVSTDPQGSLLLFDLRDDLVAAGYRTDGQDYILLGYKPGGELALRSLAQDFRGALKSDFQGNDATVGALVGGFETGKPINSLADLSLKLVLADEASDVQGWVEQIYSQTKQQPLAFLLPAEAAPIVQPYLQPPRDSQDARIGHLAGKQGALAYESLSGDQATIVQIARETGQQRLGILVFDILLLIGVVALVATGSLRQGAGA